jgi:hypothetical protein
VPIYGVWVQDDDQTGGYVQWTLSQIIIDPDGLTSFSAVYGVEGVVSSDAGGLWTGSVTNAWRIDLIYIDPSTALPDTFTYPGGPTGSPPPHAIDWEYHPDDTVIEVYSWAVTGQIEAASTLDTTAYVRLLGSGELESTGGLADFEATLTIPAREDLGTGTVIASGTVVGDPDTDYYHSAGHPARDFIASGTVGGLSTADLQPLGILAGLAMFEDGDTVPPRSHGAENDTGGGYAALGSAYVTVETYRPRRWRWIYEITTPPLLARSVSRADAGGGPPLLARGRNSRQERLTARGPL